MTGHYCDGKLVDIIRRDYMGNTAWEYRYRKFKPSAGTRTQFNTSRHMLDINSTFWTTCDSWARNLNWWGTNYPPGSGPKQVDWWGEVGVINCTRSSSSHNRGRGFDLCGVTFADGTWCDMNYSHSSNLLHKRRYLAVAANLRRYFGTVLTTWYNSAHRDHIHFDNLTAVTYIRTGVRSDTTLVQASCNFLNGESLAIDGAWGSLTEAAYNRLVTKFNLTCYSPKTNVSHAKVFLSYIVRTAMADKSAGFYRAGC